MNNEKKCCTCRHWQMAEVLSLKGKIGVMTCDWNRARKSDKEDNKRECKYERREG